MSEVCESLINDYVSGSLTIDDLEVQFATRHGPFTAVRDASLSVEPGEIHGLVGESGAGIDPPGHLDWECLPD